MRIYINHDFEDHDIRFYIKHPDWIFEKLTCLTNYSHGIENTSGVPFVSIRPYIEIDDIDHLFKLADEINNMNWCYKLVVEPFGQIRFYEDEISYE